MTLIYVQYELERIRNYFMDAIYGGIVVAKRLKEVAYNSKKRNKYILIERRRQQHRQMAWLQ